MKVHAAGLAIITIGLVVAGCAKQPAASTPAPTAPAVSSAPAVPASWLGKWTGPEGTWLEIALADGAYTVTVSNLDGPRRFPATAGNGTLAFERDGLRETLRATDGAGTGMKWLAEKSSCLSIKSGEGFCRD